MAPLTQPSKDWHQRVSQYLRNHHVHRILQAIFPGKMSVTALRDWRMVHLAHYACKVEGVIYDIATSRAEYYRLLATKIYKIQKELEKKRMQRIKEHGGGSVMVDSSSTSSSWASPVVSSNAGLSASPSQSPSSSQ